MVTMTARQLKNRTGEALRAVGLGGRVIVTMRGRPLAVLLPYGEADAVTSDEADRVFDEIRSVFASAPLPFTWEEHRAWQNRGRLSSSIRGRSPSRRGSRKTRGRR